MPSQSATDGDEEPDSGQGETVGEMDEEMNRPGSCATPIELPLLEQKVLGRLGGCSQVQGWCGGYGSEDVYRLSDVSNIDVVFDFIAAETDFEPILRIMRYAKSGDEDVNFCDPGEDLLISNTEMCAPINPQISTRSIRFDEEYEYALIIDSETLQGGEYGFNLRFGVGAVPSDCTEPVVDENDKVKSGSITTIDLGSNGVFEWEDTLPDGNGLMDGNCGGQGNEHIFPLNFLNTGTVSVSVTPSEGASPDFVPLLSLRKGCAANTELACSEVQDPSLATPGSASLNLGIQDLGPGNMLVVDNLTPYGGNYQLKIMMY